MSRRDKIEPPALPGAVRIGVLTAAESLALEVSKEAKDEGDHRGAYDTLQGWTGLVYTLGESDLPSSGDCTLRGDNGRGRNA
jgi:hypothetical protein